MKIEFKTKNLKKLAFDDKPASKLGRDVVRAYRKALNFIMNALDRQELYYPAYRLEKLVGTKKGQPDRYSMRLNLQFRLIIEFKPDGRIEVVRILEIKDYHR